MRGLLKTNNRAKEKYVKQFTSKWVKNGSVREPPRRNDRGVLFCTRHGTAFIGRQHSCYRCTYATPCLDFEHDNGRYRIRIDSGWVDVKDPDVVEKTFFLCKPFEEII